MSPRGVAAGSRQQTAVNYWLCFHTFLERFFFLGVSSRRQQNRGTATSQSFRERGRQRQRHRQTDRQTDRQTEIHTEIHTEKQRQTERQKQRETNRETEIDTERLTVRQTDRQTVRARCSVVSLALPMSTKL